MQDLRDRSGNWPQARYRSAFAGDRFIAGFISPTLLAQPGVLYLPENGARLSGVLCAPEMLTIDALSRGRRSWERRAVVPLSSGKWNELKIAGADRHRIFIALYSRR